MEMVDILCKYVTLMALPDKCDLCLGSDIIASILLHDFAVVDNSPAVAKRTLYLFIIWHYLLNRLWQA